MYLFQRLYQRQTSLVLFSILLLTIIAYIPSLFVPFYLDDMPSIANNPLFTHGNLTLIWEVYGMRFLGYLSFYGNYIISGQDTFYYHLVNLFIHLLNGLVLYKLYFLLCDYLKINTNKAFVYLVVAFWLLHPLNTQAVTYIVQRLASLVTLFTLLSLLGYFYWRTCYKARWLVLSLIAFIAACLTKQNAIFLPVFIVLAELTFAQTKVKNTLLYLLAALFFVFTLVYPFIPELIHIINLATREAKDITRLDYFNTQLFIHYIYLKKFFFIEPLTLTVDVNLIKNQTIIYYAYLVHLLVITLAWYKRKNYPLITFSVLFYYCAHSVESSIIPITDLAFEHRTYLPNVALSFIVVSLLHALFMKTPISIKNKLSTTTIYAIAIITVGVLAVITYQRNLVWQQPEKLYGQDYIQAPENPRNLEVMGRFYAENKELEKAAEFLSKSLNLNFKQGRLTASNVTNLMKVYTEQENFQAVVITGQKALKYIKAPLSRSLVLSAMAFAYTKMGICDFAKGLATAAYKLNKNNIEATQVIKYCQKVAQ